MASVSMQHPATSDSLRLAAEPAREALPSFASPEASFAIIYSQYRQRLIHVALRIVKNDADAEDVVQESLLRAYTKMDGFRGEAGIYTWLVRIVINTSLMALRKRTRHPLASLYHDGDGGESLFELIAAPGVTAEADAIQRQHTEMMYSAVTDLPPEFSALMLAWMTKERSMIELSREFGITLPAAKSRILRGKLKVAKTVKRRLNLSGYLATDELESA